MSNGQSKYGHISPEATSLSSTVTCDSYKQMFWR